MSNQQGITLGIKLCLLNYVKLIAFVNFGNKRPIFSPMWVGIGNQFSVSETKNHENSLIMGISLDFCLP